MKTWLIVGVVGVLGAVAGSAFAVYHPPGTDAIRYNPQVRGYEAPKRMVYILALRKGELLVLPPRQSWEHFNRPGVEWTP
jgi:hypothetical protein